MSKKKKISSPREKPISIPLEFEEAMKQILSIPPEPPQNSKESPLNFIKK